MPKSRAKTQTCQKNNEDSIFDDMSEGVIDRKYFASKEQEQEESKQSSQKFIFSNSTHTVSHPRLLPQSQTDSPKRFTKFSLDIPEEEEADNGDEEDSSNITSQEVFDA